MKSVSFLFKTIISSHLEMFYLNVIVKVFGLIILISNTSKCDKPTDMNSYIELDDGTISDPLLKNRNKLNFKEFNYLLPDKKKASCCSCNVNNCNDKNNPLNPLPGLLASSLTGSLNTPLKLQTNNLFQNKDSIQIGMVLLIF